MMMMTRIREIACERILARSTGAYGGPIVQFWQFGSFTPGCSNFGSFAPGCSNFGSFTPGCSNFGSFAPGCSNFGSFAPGCSNFGSFAPGCSNFGSFAPGCPAVCLSVRSLRQRPRASLTAHAYKTRAVCYCILAEAGSAVLRSVHRNEEEQGG